MNKRRRPGPKQILKRIEMNKDQKGRVDLYLHLKRYELFQRACEKESTTASAVINEFIDAFLER